MKKLFSISILVSFFLFFSCEKEQKQITQQFKGNVFGTTYSIVYTGSENYIQQIDSLFYLVNKSLSAYMPTSDISRVNKNDTTVRVDDYFIEVFKKSERIFKETDGYFDPTVGNLVNAWGFGPKKEIANFDSLAVKEQMKFVGLNKIRLSDRSIKKDFPEIVLDVNSIAKGYGIDIIGRFLENKNIENYLVEIGGEIRTKGTSLKGKKWRVGIDSPNTDGSRSLAKVIEISNMSMASSGNYRKFRVSEDGRKFVHTINPKTGFAQESNLVGAPVIANLDCADVDAYATAFMAMGLEKTKEFLKKHSEIKAILFYVDKNGKYVEYNTYTY